MARAPRIMPAGMVFHVLNRAVEGLQLFRNPNDYLQFYRLLLDAGRRVAVRVIAYCLMPTHWHLVLWPETDGAVSAYVHWLETKHSLQLRVLTDTLGRGHVYQGRFRSFPVETGRYYYNVIRYVEDNAREAGLVSRAEEWPWSSLLGRRHGDELITSGPLELPEPWEDWVNARLTRQDRQAIAFSERKGRPYGSDDWVAGVATRYSLHQTLRARGRPKSEDLGKMRLT